MSARQFSPYTLQDTARSSKLIALARLLLLLKRAVSAGWRVCITDRIGRHFKLPDLDKLLEP